LAQDDYRVTKRLRLIGGVPFDRLLPRPNRLPEFALDPRLTRIRSKFSF
jgi:hypothetical protein